MLTVRDILKMDIFEEFVLTAGEGGLEHPVTSAEILDYEYLLDIKRDSLFEKDSIVISSLLFARDNENLLLQAVKDLARRGVAAFGYKNIFFQELPESVLQFANENNFTIFRFTDNIYFEDIIFHIIDAVQQCDREAQIEEKIKKLLDESLSEQEISDLLDELNPDLGPNICVRAFQKKGKGYPKLKQKLGKKLIVSPLEKEWIMIAGVSDVQQLEPVMRDGAIAWEVNCEAIQGESRRYSKKSDIPKAIREAHYARIAAQIQGEQLLRFDDTGTYQFLIPNIHLPSVQDYMHSYLEPVLKSEKSELFDTLVQFVLSEGDLEKTAQKLFCHQNTVRYRINKLHNLLEPKAGDTRFYEQAALAIRIWLIHNLLSK